ncbi:MAG: D-alanyl-D-alanine carboxypeptidase [Clostridium sp.]|nr:D-alanyl-D-alanine carboxypeptidase [Clostridium sp.]
MGNKVFRFFIILIIFIFFVSAFQISIFAQFVSSAESAILIDASTGQILYEKNADVPMPPASITKIMTLLIGFEALEYKEISWDDWVVVSENAWSTGGSKMFLPIGERVSYRDIMTGISVVSANDGCVALAEYLYGSEEAFVGVMNKRAKELGMLNTNFVNSNGLPDPNHIMSARDISILSQYLIEQFPEILELESQTEFTFGGIRQFNRNPLLGIFPGADGLKTGWTEEAGYCIVGTAQQSGLRLVGVILKTENEMERTKAVQELLNYGFKNFKQVTLGNAGEKVDNIGVKNGSKSSVPLIIDEDVTVVIPIDGEKDLETLILKDKDLIEAPVISGTPVGKMEIRLNDQLLTELTLSTAENIDRLGFWGRVFRSIGDFFKSFF